MKPQRSEAPNPTPVKTGAKRHAGGLRGGAPCKQIANRCRDKVFVDAP